MAISGDVKEHPDPAIGKIYEDVTQIAEVRPHQVRRGRWARNSRLPDVRRTGRRKICRSSCFRTVVRRHATRWGFDWWAQALAAQG